MRRLSFAGLAYGRRANVTAVAAVMFVLGLAAGAALRPSLTPQVAAAIALAPPELRSNAPAQSSTPIPQKLGPQFAYPAEIIRVIDGDTFEARVRVWPGLDVDTKVRLRDIDAPELHARCGEELAKAQAARAALEAILAEGGVAISRVGIDKYGGRVDATASTRNTGDVSAAMLNGGWARAYGGGKRESWCG